MSDPDPNPHAIIAGTVELPDPGAAAFILERAGWEVRKSGWYEFETRGDGFELNIEAEAPVLIHGWADRPEELARRLAKTFGDADVIYSFEVYSPSKELVEIVTNC